MIKAVVFDLDDTLAPESAFVYSGFRAVAKELSVRTSIEEEVIYDKLIETYKISPKNVFNRVCSDLVIEVNNGFIQLLVEIYRNHTPNIRFYDEIIPLITELRTKGIKLGIITDGFKESQRNKLRVLGAEKYFDKIIITDELGREFWKPHPKSFELMKEMLDVEYHEMIYIGDNFLKDFIAPKELNIRTWWFRNREGVYYHEPPTLQNIDWWFEELKYIMPEILKNLEIENNK